MSTPNTLAFLKPLKSFHWHKIAAFGGWKGGREEYKALLGHLADNGIVEAREALRHVGGASS